MHNCTHGTKHRVTYQSARGPITYCKLCKREYQKLWWRKQVTKEVPPASPINELLRAWR